jgi:serine/threonine protein kinase
VVPPHAQFCGTCGERIKKTGNLAPTLEQAPSQKRYEITSLVRRRPHVELFFAIETEHQRAVGIREIDISGLDDAKRSQASYVLQQEYDLLRRHRIHDVMPVIDIHAHEGHVSTVAGWPFAILTGEQNGESQTPPRLQTLQELLQSGIGPPNERLALAWTYRLCRAVSQLHSHQIILGDLDPQAIIVSESSYSALPALMVSWLPPSIRALLPSTSTFTDLLPYSAPETLEGNIEPRSDIYSLGALLYLLLTGQAPIDAIQRTQQPLRSPQERNPHLHCGIDEVVMRALSLETTQRFQSALEMSDALMQVYVSTRSAQGRATTFAGNGQTPSTDAGSETADPDIQQINDPDDVTVSIVPIQKHLAQLHQSQQQITNTEVVEEQKFQSTGQAVPPLEKGAAESPAQSLTATHVETSLVQRFQERLSRLLPVFPRSLGIAQQGEQSRSAWWKKVLRAWFERFKRFLLAEQQHSTTAAAVIETPLRVQPNQGYTIRIQLTGRDGPTPPPDAEPGTLPIGLSAVCQGEVVHIEVRSALFQNYAYIVQRADVHLPGKDYAAEVVIPMQPLANGPTGRHDRLHVFFMDELSRPLYEKPFVVEVLISHLVQPGREGYNVLTIPF